MKRLLILFLFLPILAHAQLAPPDTCLVEGYIYGPDMKPAAGEKVFVLKAVASGFVTTLAKGEFEADASGWIRMTLFRNSRAWLYGRKVNGLEKTGGVELVIPDAATARIETLIPPATLAPTYVIAVPLPPNAGDSIHVADSLARLAYDTARAALDSSLLLRSELNAQILALYTSLDTAGAVTRAAIEADIAELYGMLAAVTGQIASLSSDLATLSSRVDTVGAAERAAIEAHNAQQDTDIAAAGKWEQTGSEIAPKAGINAVRMPSVTVKEDSATAYKKVAFLDDIHLPASKKLYWAGLPNTYFITHNAINSGVGYNISAYSDIALGSSNGRLLFSSKALFGSPSVNYYNANFGGNVWVNPDSTLYAGHIEIGNNTLAVGDTNAFKLKLGSGRTDFLIRRGNTVGGQGAIVTISGPYAGTDATLTNTYGTLGIDRTMSFSNGIYMNCTPLNMGYYGEAAHVRPTSIYAEGIWLHPKTNAGAYSSKGNKIVRITSTGTGAGAVSDADTVLSVWRHGMPAFRVLNVLADDTTTNRDSVVVVGAPTQKGGLHVHGGIDLEGGLKFSNTVLPWTISVDASYNLNFSGSAGTVNLGRNVSTRSIAAGSTTDQISGFGFMNPLRLNVGIANGLRGLNLGTGLSMPKDSTLDAGILKTPMIVIDTLYSFTGVADSLPWHFRSTYVDKWNAGFWTGECLLTFSVPSGATPREFDIVAPDSVENTQMTGIWVEITGGGYPYTDYGDNRGQGRGYFGTREYFIEWEQNMAQPKPTQLHSAGGNTGGGPTLAWSGRYSWNNANRQSLRIGVSGYSTSYMVKVRVQYRTALAPFGTGQPPIILHDL